MVGIIVKKFIPVKPRYAKAVEDRYALKFMTRADELKPAFPDSFIGLGMDGAEGIRRYRKCNETCRYYTEKQTILLITVTFPANLLFPKFSTTQALHGSSRPCAYSPVVISSLKRGLS
jgi:hypothetical protein